MQTLWSRPSEALPITSRRVNKLSQQFGRQKVCKAKSRTKIDRDRYRNIDREWKREGDGISRNSLVNEPK